MYGNGYSMAIVLDHRSTALTKTKIGKLIWDLEVLLMEKGFPMEKIHFLFAFCPPQIINGRPLRKKV